MTINCKFSIKARSVTFLIFSFFTLSVLASSDQAYLETNGFDLKKDSIATIIFSQKERPFWMDPKLNNFRDLSDNERYYQNFREPLPTEPTLNLRDFSPIDTGISINSPVKKTYRDQHGIIWMMDFAMYQTNIRRYIATGLYKLILGKYTPNEQLVKNDDGGEFIMGSEFIKDFVTFYEFTEEKGLYGFSKEKECLAECNCDGIDIKNVWLTVASMILLGENDAHESNVGVVRDRENSYGFAQVDNKNAGDASTIKALLEGNLKSRAFNLTSLSHQYSKDFYKYVLANNYAFAHAMEIIASIPDDFWQLVITERARFFIEETSGIPKNKLKKYSEDDKKIIGEFLQLKKQASYFANSLYLEGAVLEDDIETIEKLVALVIDVNKKYSYINISYHIDTYRRSMSEHGLPITPLEMAVKANSQKAIEYLFRLSNDQTKKRGILEAIRIKNVDALKFFTKDSFIFSDTVRKPAIIESFLSGNDKMFYFFFYENSDILNKPRHLLSTKYNKTDILKMFLSRGSLDIHDISALIEFIFKDRSHIIYEILADAGIFTYDDYLNHLALFIDVYEKDSQNLYYNFGKSRIVYKALMGLKGGGADRAKKALDLLVWHGKENCLYKDHRDMVIKTLMQEVGDDQFFIASSLRVKEYGYAEKVADSFITPEISCGLMLQQMLKNNEILFDIKSSTVSTYSDHVHSWEGVFLKLIKNPKTNKNDIRNSLSYLLDNNHHEIVNLILE